MRSGSVVVLSGGLDSTVCLAEAVDSYDPVIAFTVDYGQRHRIELERASLVAAHYGVEHVVQCLDLASWGGSAITDERLAVPTADEAAAGAGIPITYVPGRNLIFLSLAVALAEVRGFTAVYIGVNALDYSGYPDCRPEFVDSFRTTAALALRCGIEGEPISVLTPLVSLSKADIVRRAADVRAPVELTWSCYRGESAPCDNCDACALRAKGFAEAGITDPARHG